MSLPGGPDVTRNEPAQPDEQEPFELVPGLAEDFLAAGAAFVAACGGNSVLGFAGSPADGLPAPRGPRPRP